MRRPTCARDYRERLLFFDPFPPPRHLGGNRGELPATAFLPRDPTAPHRDAFERKDLRPQKRSEDGPKRGFLHNPPPPSSKSASLAGKAISRHSSSYPFVQPFTQKNNSPQTLTGYKCRTIPRLQTLKEADQQKPSSISAPSNSGECRPSGRKHPKRRATNLLNPRQKRRCWPAAPRN